MVRAIREAIGDDRRMLSGGVAEVLDRATREGKSPESVAATVKAVVKRVIKPRVG
jgi:hypothetical protein